MSPLVSKLVAVLFISFLAGVNYIGVRWGANLQNLLTFIKTAAIVGISAAIFYPGKENVANLVEPQPGKFSMNLLSAFGVAMVATFWAYKGWESATYSDRRGSKTLKGICPWEFSSG